MAHSRTAPSPVARALRSTSPARLAGLVLALTLALLTGTARAAEALPPPEGEVVLTLRGGISRHNAGTEAQFDLALLQALPQTSFATSTVWTDGVSTYSGVLLRDLLAAVGAEGSRLTATAIDGYQITIPLQELGEDGPIVAHLRDGAPMPVRERGPLWIIFPFDDNPAFRNDTTYARSIWQLTLIEIED